MCAIQVDPGAKANQRNVSKGDFLAHSTRRVSCRAPWKGDHDGTLTEHTAEDTLDKSRRRDTMFPHSFCVTSVSQWPFIACHKLCDFRLGKKAAWKFILGQEWFKAQNQSWMNLAHSGLNNLKQKRNKIEKMNLLGKQRSVTACQQFHKCRYVRVISPDILKTP